MPAAPYLGSYQLDGGDISHQNYFFFSSFPVFLVSHIFFWPADIPVRFMSEYIHRGGWKFIMRKVDTRPGSNYGIRHPGFGPLQIQEWVILIQRKLHVYRHCPFHNISQASFRTVGHMSSMPIMWQNFPSFEWDPVWVEYQLGRSEANIKV